jgi:hypothetical protein
LELALVSLGVNVSVAHGVGKKACGGGEMGWQFVDIQ